MQHKRFGTIALLGPTNAGKSTLMNAMLGEKLAITSRKVQTTRFRIRGVMVHDMSQIVLVDTPGFFDPRRPFDEGMIKEAEDATRDMDLLILVVDAQRGKCTLVERVLAKLRVAQTPVILVLNKVDLLEDKMSLLPLSEQFMDAYPFEEIHYVSSTTHQGMDDLISAIAKKMPTEIWHYDEDTLTDMPMRVLAAETVREHLYDVLHQELPYDALVETERFLERADGSAAIHILITVKRDGQKALVLGRQGKTVKHIGKTAREALARAWGRPIHLFIQVRVRADWDKHYDPKKMFGLS